MNILPQGPMGIGEILGQGLADVASHWSGLRTTEKALKGLGFTPAQAKAYAHLSPQIQQQAIHARQQQEAQQASQAAINQILGQGLPSYNPVQQTAPQAIQAVPQRPQGMPQAPLLPHERQQAALQEATSIAQNPAFRKLQEQQQQAAALQQQQLASPHVAQGQPAITGEQAAILQSQQPKEPSLKEQIEMVRNQKRALGVANLPANQIIALHQQLDNKEKELRKEERERKKEERLERDESREERKISHDKQKHIDSETKETYHKTNDMAHGAKESNMRLDRIERLLDKGNVQDSTFIRSLDALSEIKHVGKLFEVLERRITNTDTQEFKKLSTDFLRDAKKFFGSRITENEVQMFLQTVPSLSQTNDGKRRVIRNMRIFNEGAILRKKAMDDLIKENGGNRPANLESLIDERIGDKLDSLANDFKEGAVSGRSWLGTLASIAFPSLS